MCSETVINFRQIHIVDDDAEFRRSIAGLLSTLGYHTHAWTNGQAFLRASTSLAPSCVILDLTMPGMNGLEVLQGIEHRRLEMPVIFVTGTGDIKTSVKAMRMGAQSFIEKPFDPGELREALDEAFERLSHPSNHASDREESELRIAKLTNREREVLQGLLKGLPNKSIAFELNISPRTVEVHRANIMRKLNAKSFAEVLRVGFEATQ